MESERAVAEKAKSSINLPGLTQDLPEKNKLVHLEGPSQNSHKVCVCVVCMGVCRGRREHTSLQPPIELAIYVHLAKATGGP